MSESSRCLIHPLTKHNELLFQIFYQHLIKLGRLNGIRHHDGCLCCITMLVSDDFLL